MESSHMPCIMSLSRHLSEVGLACHVLITISFKEKVFVKLRNIAQRKTAKSDSFKLLSYCKCKHNYKIIKFKLLYILFNSLHTVFQHTGCLKKTKSIEITYIV